MATVSASRPAYLQNRGSAKKYQLDEHAARKPQAFAKKLNSIFHGSSHQGMRRKASRKGFRIGGMPCCRTHCHRGAHKQQVHITSIWLLPSPWVRIPHACTHDSGLETSSFRTRAPSLARRQLCSPYAILAPTRRAHSSCSHTRTHPLHAPSWPFAPTIMTWYRATCGIFLLRTMPR